MASTAASELMVVESIGKRFGIFRCGGFWTFSLFIASIFFMITAVVHTFSSVALVLRSALD